MKAGIRFGYQDGVAPAGWTAGVTPLLAVCVLAVLAACSDPLDVPRFELPPPSTGLDPDSLRLGELRYICDRWVNGGAPTVPAVILDAFFGQRDASDPDDRPRVESLKAVAAAGGAVGHEFKFPAARIKIAPERVPELARSSGAVLYSVPDLRRYDWHVAAAFSRDLTPADDSAFIAAGGRITHRLLAVRILMGVLPDRSLPTLRARRGVMSVGGNGHFCDEGPQPFPNRESPSGDPH